MATLPPKTKLLIRACHSSEKPFILCRVPLCGWWNTSFLRIGVLWRIISWLPMGVHDEFYETQKFMYITKILWFYSILSYQLSFFYYHISSGAWPALPMRVSPEATAKYLHLGVGSTLLLTNSILFIVTLSYKSVCEKLVDRAHGYKPNTPYRIKVRTEHNNSVR
jgi:hypothetical protein